MTRSQPLNSARAIPIAFALILNVVMGPLMPFAQQLTRAANDGIDNYSQCQIGNPSSGLDCEQWINGILNATHNNYSEDEVVPQRLVLDAGSTGPHSVQISYMARKDSGTQNHAYDYLATWNYTYVNADRCQNLQAALCLGGPVSTFPIPSDTNSVTPGGPQPTSAHELPQANRQFVMYGGTLTGTSSITHTTDPLEPGSDYGVITVNFNVTNAGGEVMLLFGGHLAAGFGPRGWGANLGAASISGGPYHIRITQVDGASIGNRDNQIMSNAISPLPGLALSKSTSTPIITAGDTASYTISLVNNGDGDATGVTITDNLPGGLTWSDNSASCSVSGGTLTCGPMTVAAHTTFTVTVTATTTAGNCPSLSNTASYTSTNGGSGSTAANPTVITVNCPVLAITKQADDASVDAGDPIGFAITVTNNGPGTAKNVTLNDPLPAGTGVSWSISPAYAGPGSCSITGSVPNQLLTCSFGDMAATASASVHVSSATGNQTCATLNNTATASADNTASVHASDAIVISCHPDVAVEKSTSTSVVSAGDQVSYSIIVTAGGSGDSLNVVLSDTLPANVDWDAPSGADAAACDITGGVLTCNFGTMSPGTSKHVTLTGTTSADTCPGIENTATVSATADSDSSNNSAGPVPIAVDCPDLVATKTADNDPVNAGQQIGFTINVLNNGEGTAHDVALDDPLPAWADLDWSIADQPDGDPCSISGSAGAQTLVCSFGDLLGGTGVSVHVVSNTTADDCTTFNNVASVTASNHPELNPSDDVTVECPGLNIAKTAADPAIHGGDVASFTIVVWNVGPGTAIGATLNDPLPAGESGSLDWSLDPAYAGPGTCDITGNPGAQTLSCSFGDLAAGTTKDNPSASITVVATTTPNDACATLDNTATVTAQNNPSVDASASIDLACPKLVIEKAASVDEVHFVFNADGSLKSVTPANAQVTWTLSYTLTDGPVTNAVISDPLPDFLTFVSAGNGGTYDPATRTITWSFALLSDSGTVSFVTTVDQDAPETGPIVNVASIVSDQTPKDDGQDAVHATSEQVEAATPAPSVPNTAVTLGQNGQPIQIPIELLVVFFLGSLGTLAIANVKAARRRR